MIIKEINYGTGNRVGDTIYINKDLHKYPRLHNAIMEHELKHTGGFKLKDLKLDLINNELKPVREDWFDFLLKHPRAWVNFSPVMRLDGEWTFDLSISIVWAFMITLIILGWIIT